MHNNILKNLPLISAVTLVTAMTAVSEITGEKEILFPEIAAIAAGALVSTKLAWNTSSIRLFCTIAVGSIVGIFIVLFLPVPLVLQMCLAFLIASVILSVSGTTFAPLISSIVLPVMLQTRSVIYPISAVTLTGIILLLKSAFEHFGITEKTEFKPEPMPDRNCISDMLIKWACGSLVITIAVISGFKLAAAPPLLVAFTEFWKPGSKAQHKPIIIILLITVCAFIGSLTRYAAIIFGFYCFISAGIAITVVLLIMKKTMLIIPPAAALSILAYLIPEQQLVVYPILVMIGISMFTGISVIHGKLLEEKQN